MLARETFRWRGLVHVHFHDWELVDRRRALAIELLLRSLRLRRSPLSVDRLAGLARGAAETTINAS